MKCRRNKLSKGAPLRMRKAGAANVSPAAPGRAPATGPELASSVRDPAAAPAELNIDGHTEGSIDYAGTVRVGAQGAVTGEIRAQTIIVEGAIDGDLHASTAIRILASARVTGDVHAPHVAVMRGAQLRGRITMRRVPEPAAALDEYAAAAMLAGARQR
jgi:cytoskeletal protein CcmA (bactofilin family)